MSLDLGWRGRGVDGTEYSRCLEWGNDGRKSLQNGKSINWIIRPANGKSQTSNEGTTN